MKKILVNGQECDDNTLILNHDGVAIACNGENLQIYGKGNSILVPAGVQ